MAEYTREFETRTEYVVEFRIDPEGKWEKWLLGGYGSVDKAIELKNSIEEHHGHDVRVVEERISREVLID
ncbi:hypothetical protein [Salinibacter phage M8CRM-1]|uniref:Uncharacterized protein n=1 Tax=Salinibacter phage M8CRM-1 TaxID=2681612 RepID=A0A2I6UGR8_9CAUD|nr:hypothetical protein FGG67_gp07 [Salinibacter phage M8CRM-1]AUO79175.1 hypothetical protein [Salinibacter phage M8CRM-1]